MIAENTSVPQIPFIVVDPVLSTDSSKLFLKRDPPVMLVLILNIPPDGGDLRGAHRKRPVPALPMKLGIEGAFRLDPFRRGLLNVLDQFGDREGLRKRTQGMDMIGGPTHLERWRLIGSEPRGEIGVSTVADWRIS